jgi:hypothetical protein
MHVSLMSELTSGSHTQFEVYHLDLRKSVLSFLQRQSK